MLPEHRLVQLTFASFGWSIGQTGTLNIWWHIHFQVIIRFTTIHLAVLNCSLPAVNITWTCVPDSLVYVVVCVGNRCCLSTAASFQLCLYIPRPCTSVHAVQFLIVLYNYMHMSNRVAKCTWCPWRVCVCVCARCGCVLVHYFVPIIWPPCAMNRLVSMPWLL